MSQAERRATDRGALFRLTGLIGFLAIWWLAAQAVASPNLLPSPLRVAIYTWHATESGDLPRQMAFTLARVLVAFVIAMAAGSAAGYAMGRSARIDAIADPWLVIALNLPLLLVVILAYIWIGLNDLAAVLAVVAAKAPSVVVTLREGSRALDPGLDDMAAVFRLPYTRRLREVVLPQLAPYLAAAGRSGLSITWKIVLVVELLGRPNGIGFVLNSAFQNFDVTAILAYGLAFAVIMLVVEAGVLQPLERRARAWRGDA
ncbi:MAG TPA: ABC transporter permease subunit [Acidisphaera sp.]|nr:ABC transporter permease subunit [Acidisphaera sp.]